MGAPVYSAGGYKVNTTTSKTLVTSSFAVTEGMLVVVAAQGWASGKTPTISDTASSTWTKVFSSDQVFGSSGGTAYANMWYTLVANTESAEEVTATFAATTNDTAICAAAFSGLPSITVDVSLSTGAAGETITLSDFTTVNPFDFVVVGWGGRGEEAGSYTLTASAGATPSVVEDVGTTSYTLALGTQVLTGILSNASYTGGHLEASENMVIMAVAFEYSGSLMGRQRWRNRNVN